MQDSLTAGAPLRTGHDDHGRLRDWLREGLRAGCFRRPRVPAPEPFPFHFLLLVLGMAALRLLGARLAIPGDARFSFVGWLAPWCFLPPAMGLAWWLFRAGRPHAGRPGVAAWYLLWSLACWPLELAYVVLEVASDRSWPGTGNAWVGWGLSVVLTAWSIGLAAWIARTLGLPRKSVAMLAAGLFAISTVLGLQFQDYKPWYPIDPPAKQADEPRLELSQETFEEQQAVWTANVDALAPQRPGVRDVYGIVFAPYGSEDVFLRESNLAASVLRERFDGNGRVLQLLNHLSTLDKLPWATPLNLERAVQAVAQVMDKREDVLVVYMTSHGGRDFKLASSFWPLEVPDLTPQQLRAALDKAGIRNRVLMVSACYSGGWVEPLASDTTLVMTAADATHTSYGCGRKSELTYFGRAMWDEQLRRTHSFEEAFAAAVPVIRQREVDAKKTDGFSNPQIRVGAALRPVLAEVAARLGKAATP